MPFVLSRATASPRLRAYARRRHDGQRRTHGGYIAFTPHSACSSTPTKFTDTRLPLPYYASREVVAMRCCSVLFLIYVPYSRAMAHVADGPV